MKVNMENLQDTNNIPDKIRWEGVWKWLKEAFRQIQLGWWMDGKHPTFLFHQQLVIQIKETFVSSVLKFKLQYLAKASKRTVWHSRCRWTTLTMSGCEWNEWMKPTCFCPSGYGFTLKRLSFQRMPMVYLCQSLWNVWWLNKEGQSLLIKIVEINPMTLLPDSHLQYISFMNQTFLPEALKLYI